MQIISFGEFEIVVRTLFGEARGEPREGKHAVVWVIVNRARIGRAYGGPELDGVCLKRKQFSCWNVYDPMRAKIKAATFTKLANCVAAAHEVLTGKVPDPTGGATHYLNPEMTRRIRGDGKLPSWAEGVTPVKIIGAHHFFKLDE